MIDLVIGAGQGGSRIAKAFSDVYEVEGRYLNLTDVDFNKFDAPRNHIFVLDEGGTGRDSGLGEELVRKNSASVYKFLKEGLTLQKAKIVAFCVGGGGGSGTGFMFPILEFLLEEGMEVILVYTLPQKKEGLPAQPNALKALNRLIEAYIGHGHDKSCQVAPILIDNDFCQEKYGQDESSNTSDYWARVNRAIAFSLKRFYNLTTLGSKNQEIDIASGYNALDYREFKRILLFKDGFLDIREIQLKSLEEAENLRASLKSSSLLNGSMDVNTAKAYIVSVALPEEWKAHGQALHVFLDRCFDAVSKMTKTPFVMRSSYFSPKIKSARISMLLAGMTKSHGLDKHIKSAVKNVEKFKAKGDVSPLDVQGLEFD